MKFLVDNALSAVFSNALVANGRDSVHVRDRGVQHADDQTIFALAQAEGRVLVSADTDFGTLLALRRSVTPSFILFRGEGTRLPAAQASLLLANLPSIQDALHAGAVVVIQRSRLRIRSLPIGGED